MSQSPPKFDESKMVELHDLGMKQAVEMARGGNLRLSPLPFEREKYPYTTKLRPIKATVLIWKAWLREVRRGGY